ncbi:hypothetical protein [Pacificimonas flava]|uniref:MobA/MobL protein domain-containing protein n=1 Tax=Pacificimonas flava TaxID=1234595 RepID=M2SC17_9SPHN|nr:hypothetical protein [Pacificimonas flava]EMD82900.1 hypothetical protein C725_1498 [Pacificimonas flava]MBB5280063.1 hypothetical protein [Pacificimonas flava]
MAKTAKAAPDKSAAAELKSFTNGAGAHPNFSFTRYWWDGDGPRDGIKSWVEKKLAPGEDPVFGKAAKSEVLIPDAASSDYAEAGFLLEQFDTKLPAFERHAFIQVKITLEESISWTAGYEKVRAYAREHFVGDGHPVIIVAHVPGAAGSANANHVHIIVLSRTLGINGFGQTNHTLCSDRGHGHAWEMWGRGTRHSSSATKASSAQH